ncbi:hypothetical protein OG809_34600 [Kribbella soli]
MNPLVYTRVPSDHPATTHQRRSALLHLAHRSTPRGGVPRRGCDLRFAARESAIFGQIEPAFGLVPGLQRRPRCAVRRHNPGVTEIKKMPDRGHALTIDHGWEEVAQTALEFVKRFAPAKAG